MKKWLICLVLLAIAPFVLLHCYKFVNIDEADVCRFISDPIISGKEIVIPGFPGAYNPSIVPFGEGYLLSFRVTRYNLVSWVQKLFNSRTSFLGLVTLDRDFNMGGKAELLDVRSYNPAKKSAPQDARLYCLGEKIYVLFNDYISLARWSQALYIAEITFEEGHFQLASSPRPLQYPEALHKIEKNWSPFSYEGKLYVVYSIEPHTIAEVDPSTGICRTVEKTRAQIEWNFGEARGGTPSLSIGDEYLSFFHSSKKGVPSLLSKKNGRVYFMGAYTFASKPPFAVQRITKAPLARREDYFRNNPKKISYPSGILLDGDKIHVLWGQSDARIRLTTFDKEKLLSSMTQ